MTEIIPSEISYSIANFEVYTPTTYTSSDSLKVIARPFPTHQYRCKLTLVPSRARDDSRERSALLESLSGRSRLLEVQIPFKSKPRGILSGVVSVKNSANYGQTNIVLNTFLPTAIGVVKAGDCFVFAGHTKVYTAKYDADSVGGDVTIELTLPLLKSVSVAELVTYDNVPFTMRQRQDTRSFKVTGGSTHVGHSLDLEEDIP